MTDTKKKRTPRAKAKKKRLPKDFEELLEQGADLATLTAVFETCEVDARGGYGKETALMMRGCPEGLTRWLVAQGADLAAVDDYGNTPLHAQARAPGGSDNVRALIELGADLHAATSSLGTPLHHAVDAKNEASVKLLLAAGARVDAGNRRELTPLEIGLQRCTNAELEGMAKVTRLLLEAGASKKPSMKAMVKGLGETFEFHRAAFSRDQLAATSAALAYLCECFEVEPPPQRRMHDGQERIRVEATTWQKRHAELWDYLVPSSGPAQTVQGEVIRIAGRIGDEICRNGGGNWDGHYRAMAKAFLDHVRGGSALPAEALGICESVVTSLVSSRTGEVDRLAEYAVAWVMLNPEPARLGRVAYDR